MGLLLGDGSIKYGVSITTTDAEILSYCEQAARQWWCDLKPFWGNGKINKSLGKPYSPSYRFARIKNRKPGAANDPRGININCLKEALVAIDVYGKTAGEKSVPFQYKTASRFDRLEMLAGLMDTDGSLDRNDFDYLSKSERLVDDVAFLARSVGLAAYKAKKMVPYKGEARPYAPIGESISAGTRISSQPKSRANRHSLGNRRRVYSAQGLRLSPSAKGITTASPWTVTGVSC